MDLLLTLKRRAGTPLYRILAEAVEEAIVEQKLAPGSSLPSTRELSHQYNLSISTANRAYDELAGLGIVVTSPSSGTRVSPNWEISHRRQNHSDAEAQTISAHLREPHLSEYAQRLESTCDLVDDDDVAIPGADVMPTNSWHRILSKHRDAYNRQTALEEYVNEPFGHVPLRQAIANFLKRTRGIVCSADQVVVTTALRLDLLCRLLIDAGDDVAMEDPCSPTARRVVYSHGAKLHPIAGDHDGLNPEALLSGQTKYKMLYVCPSHQEPTGIKLSLERRKTILEWSQRTDTAIIENDFDSNFHYRSSPLPALFSLVENDTIFYSGSFWLSLGPLASVGFCVVPERYIPAMQILISTVHPEPPVPENYALTEFINDDHLERHIHKQRGLFTTRRQKLIIELSRQLPRQVAFKESSGMHVLLQFDSNLNQQAIVDGAIQAGLPLKSTKAYYAGDRPINEYIIPFSILDEETIPDLSSRFVSLMKSVF